MYDTNLDIAKKEVFKAMLMQSERELHKEGCDRDRATGDGGTGDGGTGDGGTGDSGVGNGGVGDRATGDRASGDEGTEDGETGNIGPRRTCGSKRKVHSEGMRNPVWRP